MNLQGTTQSSKAWIRGADSL